MNTPDTSNRIRIIREELEAVGVRPQHWPERVSQYLNIWIEDGCGEAEFRSYIRQVEMHRQEFLLRGAVLSARGAYGFGGSIADALRDGDPATMVETARRAHVETTEPPLPFD